MADALDIRPPQRPAAVVAVPLLPIAAAFAVGIAAGRYLPLPTSGWLVAAVVALLAGGLTLVLTGRYAPTWALGVVCVLALGGARCHDLYSDAPRQSLVTRIERPSMGALRGVVVSRPEITEARHSEYGGYRPPYTRFLLDVSAQKTLDGWRPATGLVRATVREPAGHIRPGQSIEMPCWIGRPGRPDNPGQFDSAAFGRLRGQHLWAAAPAAEAVKVLDAGPRWSLDRWLLRLRGYLARRLVHEGEPGGGEVVNALVLGERSASLRELNQAMVASGTAHLLSISGLHLGIFLGVVYLGCRIVGMALPVAATAVLAVLVLYLLAAEPRPGLLRSGVMAMALCLSAMSRRDGNALNALAAAALLLLAWDPLQLFHAGFQLSFTVVVGIVVFLEPVREVLFGRYLRRRGLRVYRQNERVERWVRFTLADWLMSGVAMALLAWLLSAPLIAFHFGLFSPYAPVLSILLLPLVGPILFLGYLSLALHSLAPNLSWHLGQGAETFAAALSWTVQKLQVLPALSLRIRPLPAAWVLGLYAAVGVYLARRFIPAGRAVAVALVVAMLAWGGYMQTDSPPPRAAQLDLLSVGGGQVGILRVPSGPTFVMDAGSQRGPDVGGGIVMPFLRQQRLPWPRVAFVSHANSDHFNALIPLLEGGYLQTLYVNAHFRGMARRSSDEAWRLLELADRMGCRVIQLHAGDEVNLDATTKVTVLHPRKGWTPPSANDSSLVLRIQCQGSSVLLTGDIEKAGQLELLKRPGELASDVLVLPHHGSWEPTLPEFTDCVGPKLWLVSAERQRKAPLRSGPAGAAFYNRFQRLDGYRCTARHGWIRVRFARGRAQLNGSEGLLMR